MNTNEQKHTPGPLTAKWLCEALLVYRDHGGVPTQELVAEIMQRSAAPDLLEALDGIIARAPQANAEYHTVAIPHGLWEAARAAIAKAK